ncbi:hypothetical protein LCGC14_1930040 [marine sediment metagenome]|uniref:Uncharacterized protein n=1 Tax=marine sediment metagenome TaxID=412755 RepID=A0A0F9I271_9ZZZZ
MDPYNQDERRLWFDAIETHYKELEPFRVGRTQLIKEYAGPYFGKRSPNFPTYVNLMQQTADAHEMALAANCPRFLIATHYDPLKAFASTYQAAINYLVQEIRIEEVLAECVQDAFFSVGIAKVHRGGKGKRYPLQNGTSMDPGASLVERLSMDDVVWDTGALSWKKVSFVCDRARVPFEMLSDRRRYDPKVVAQLRPSSKYPHGSHERASEIASGRVTDDGEPIPMIDLLNVWIPEDRKVVQWAVDPEYKPIDTDPLWVESWDKIITGPYYMLNLGRVPDNVMGSSPASNLRNLGELTNSLIRKGAEQAESERTINLYRPDVAKEANRARKAGDNEWLASVDPSGFAQLKIGGVNQPTAAFQIGIQSLYDRMSGNVPGKLGLGAQTDTVGQEQMIQAQISRGEAAMRNKVLRFTADIGQCLGNLLWRDATKEIRVSERFSESLTIPHVWRPYEPSNWFDRGWVERRAREGNALDYNFRVEPISMAYEEPQAKAARLRGMVIEMAPLVEAGILRLDGDRLIARLGEYYNDPALGEIFQAQMPGIPAGPVGTGGRMPSHTIRESVRRSVADGPTQENAQQQLAQQMMKNAGQQQQANGSRV